jgi:Schlafen, AlbA_2
VPTLSEQLFGTRWENLSLDDVRAFFSDAGEEGLTWEAKGGEFGPHMVRKSACAFANSERGGFLILGIGGNARQGWRVEGMEIGSDDPELRVGQIIRSGVQPTPRFTDPKTWRLEDDKLVMLIEIESVAVPPAITSHGQVYERVSGESVPVQNPARLAALFSSGEAARTGAETRADRAAQELSKRDDTPPHIISGRWDEAGFGLAISATAYSEDIASRLFTPEFDEQLARSILPLSAFGHQSPLGPPTPADGLSPYIFMQEGTFYSAEDYPAQDTKAAFAVGAFWDGTAAAGWITEMHHVSTDSMLESRIAPVWAELVTLVEALGGSGPGYLTLAVPWTSRVVGGPRTVAGNSVVSETVVIRREVELRAPNETEIARLRRELKRAGGLRQHEPSQ